MGKLPKPRKNAPTRHRTPRRIQLRTTPALPQQQHRKTLKESHPENPISPEPIPRMVLYKQTRRRPKSTTTNRPIRMEQILRRHQRNPPQSRKSLEETTPKTILLLTRIRDLLRKRTRRSSTTPKTRGRSNRNRRPNLRPT